MANITVFEYQNNKVRTVDVNGEAWFVLKDVCGVLDIADHKVVARRLDEDEVCQTPLTDSMGRQQSTTIINESGLYHVILRSDKPEAGPFRKWVTNDVLPTIRKTGSYMMPKMTKELQAIFLLDKRTAQLDQRVTALENNAVIDYGQQRTLTSAVNRRVIADTLGGKGSPACDNPHVRGVVYCEINKDLQNWFRVNARNNIPRKRFDEAIEYVNRWKPSTNTAMLIQQTNGQTSLYDAYEASIRG